MDMRELTIVTSAGALSTFLKRGRDEELSDEWVVGLANFCEPDWKEGGIIFFSPAEFKVATTESNSAVTGLSKSLTLLWAGGELGTAGSGDFTELNTGNLDLGKYSSFDKLMKGFLDLGWGFFWISSTKGLPFLFLELKNGFLELDDGEGIWDGEKLEEAEVCFGGVIWEVLLGEGIWEGDLGLGIWENFGEGICETVWVAGGEEEIVGIWERLGIWDGALRKGLWPFPTLVADDSTLEALFAGGKFTRISVGDFWGIFDTFSILLDLGKGEEEGATTDSFGLSTTRPDKLSRGWGLPLSKGGKALVLAVSRCGSIKVKGR